MLKTNASKVLTESVWTYFLLFKAVASAILTKTTHLSKEPYHLFLWKCLNWNIILAAKIIPPDWASPSHLYYLNTKGTFQRYPYILKLLETVSRMWKQTTYQVLFCKWLDKFKQYLHNNPQIVCLLQYNWAEEQLMISSPKLRKHGQIANTCSFQTDFWYLLPKLYILKYL